MKWDSRKQSPLPQPKAPAGHALLPCAQEAAEPADFSSLKGFNPKEIKSNAAEIIKAGAALYDALGAEPELREDRARAVAGHVDTDFVENSIQEAISQVGVHVCACVLACPRVCGQRSVMACHSAFSFSLHDSQHRPALCLHRFPPDFTQVEDHIQSTEQLRCHAHVDISTLFLHVHGAALLPYTR